MTSLRKILFVAEAATLAHITRPLVLANGLSEGNYDVHFASEDRFSFVFGNNRFQRWHINSLSAEIFLERVAKGKPIFDYRVLLDYVRDDLKLIEKVKPDVIVGDLRLSLQISARLARVPYLGLVNAYWSPYSHPNYIVPDHFMVRLLGARIANAGFKLIAPTIMAAHTIPMNRARARYRMSLLPSLRHVYTDADQVLYVDAAQLIPTFNLPPNHQYLGPVVWSPSLPMPDWWSDMDPTATCVYVTMGSSGDTFTLPTILAALAELPVVVVVATAGRSPIPAQTPNARFADFLPGLAACARASLVICNGGSPTTLQALAMGVPVLGVATNMDQYLNIEYVKRAGAGSVIRSESLSKSTVRDTCQSLLSKSNFRDSADTLRKAIATYDPVSNLSKLIDQLV